MALQNVATQHLTVPPGFMSSRAMHTSASQRPDHCEPASLPAQAVVQAGSITTTTTITTLISRVRLVVFA